MCEIYNTLARCSSVACLMVTDEQRASIGVTEQKLGPIHKTVAALWEAHGKGGSGTILDQGIDWGRVLYPVALEGSYRFVVIDTLSRAPGRSNPDGCSRYDGPAGQPAAVGQPFRSGRSALVNI